MFDVGEEAQAKRVVRSLRAAGGDAWVASLARLDLPTDADLNDYHRVGNGSATELTRLIASEREAS
jgi:hypothetical protein